MSKSFCIKTNNSIIIDELAEKIEKINLDNIYISQKSFALYENLIVHYIGDNTHVFIESLSNALADVIIKFYEKNILKKIINENYFYFFDFERNDILNTCIDNLCEFDFNERFDKVYSQCFSYISDSKSMVLDGFVRFRLYDYTEILDEIVDYSINKYLIQREYLEFIRLLKDYINCSESNCSKIHLIYSENNAMLLNEENIIIPIEHNLSNAKFLSDISFSKNDYCLNTLLTILPKEIVIHLLSPEDEFIETVKSIFADRVSICNSCELCVTNAKLKKS